MSSPLDPTPRFERAADGEGFHRWLVSDPDRFVASYGVIRCRAEAGGLIRCRVDVGPRQANFAGAIHGGFILAYVDQVAYCGPAFIGRMSPGGAVTLSANTSFIGAGTVDQPLDGVVEIVGETGRMMFLRGIMEQAGRTVASFDVTLRKISTRAGVIAAA